MTRPPLSCPAHGHRTTGRWRFGGLALGLGLGALAVAVLAFPDRTPLAAAGPMNPGHEGLACRECHVPSAGTAAQQVSANLYHWLGLRRTGRDFGSKSVETADCLACHERADDHHPVSRFVEPRFAAARAVLPAHECAACHLEHRGQRVTVTDLGYCVLCHQEIALTDDPIEPAHADLALEGAWSTCLRCHDFHGSSRRPAPDRLEAGVSEPEIRNYFARGPSPYGAKTTAKAPATRLPAPAR